MLQEAPQTKTPQIGANRIKLFGSYRPKIWLRRAPPSVHLPIKEYILNYGTQGEAKALENLCRALGRGE